MWPKLRKHRRPIFYDGDDDDVCDDIDGYDDGGDGDDDELGHPRYLRQSALC